jgi:hypothetical protein
MRNRNTLRLAPWVAVPLALVAPEAWAYLDPSTGSMILSAIVGMFATAALALKTYWYKLKGLFRRGARREEPGARKAEPARDSKPAAD